MDAVFAMLVTPSEDDMRIKVILLEPTLFSIMFALFYLHHYHFQLKEHVTFFGLHYILGIMQEERCSYHSSEMVPPFYTANDTINSLQTRKSVWPIG